MTYAGIWMSPTVWLIKLDKVYPVGYILGMIEIRQTDYFIKWIRGLRDIRARARVQARIDRLADGNPGDVKPIGEGVSEMRIRYGPGYRVYYTWQGKQLIVLLAGGDKRTQKRDIERALLLAREL